MHYVDAHDAMSEDKRCSGLEETIEEDIKGKAVWEGGKRCDKSVLE